MFASCTSQHTYVIVQCLVHAPSTIHTDKHTDACYAKWKAMKRNMVSSCTETTPKQNTKYNKIPIRTHILNYICVYQTKNYCSTKLCTQIEFFGNNSWLELSFSIWPYSRVCSSKTRTAIDRMVFLHSLTLSQQCANRNRTEFASWDSTFNEWQREEIWTIHDDIRVSQVGSNRSRCVLFMKKCIHICFISPSWSPFPYGDWWCHWPGQWIKK